jgi:ribosomal protein S18 acetylase RimI-like enzyme
MTEAAAIRPLREEDIPTLAALAREIWRAHYPGIISVAQIEYMLAERYDEAVIREELKRNDLWWDVLMLNGQMTGYSSYFFAGALTGVASEMKIDKLYLHPRAHRQGYGGMLIQRVAAAATQRGCTRLTLAVNRHNQRAIDAYHKHGFHVASTSVREIGGGFLMDDYIMVKELV